MNVELDLAKREAVLQNRDLDARCDEVFQGRHLTFEDDRHDYGEARFITVGYLDARMAMFAWTPRHGSYRIITMRKVNAREKALFGPCLD